MRAFDVSILLPPSVVSSALPLALLTKVLTEPLLSVVFDLIKRIGSVFFDFLIPTLVKKLAFNGLCPVRGGFWVGS